MSENQNPNILPYYTSSFLVHNRDEYKKEGEKGKEEIRERKKKKKKKRRVEGGGFIKIFFLFITREPPNQKSSLSVCVAQSSAASDVMS
jgi:hypothetical protein